MNTRLNIAQTLGSASTWGLKHIFHRPAANFPGKIGLYADPYLIADLRSRIREGTIIVVGTNGKTTVTNLIADTLEMTGKQVACNRTGANLDSGIATTLLQTQEADWGVFESDELWLSRIASGLEPDCVILLNLFRDQLDRMGEITLIQESIAGTLKACPSTTLIYNSDDPFCQAIADCIDNPSIPFGIADNLGLPQNTVSDSGMCQHCDGMLEYRWRQYGQLGNYSCPNCGFTRFQPVYTACDITANESGSQLALQGGKASLHLDTRFSGTYMIYNMLAAYAAVDRCDVAFTAFEHAVQSFDPHNGRSQRYEISGSSVFLNLAKNPTGFNQNLRIIMNGSGQRAVAFFINDREADGHDISWLWDVDFQELGWAHDLQVFAGGLRRNDLQVRLKHAGIDAQLVESAQDFLLRAQSGKLGITCYLIANYTALPKVKKELDHLQNEGVGKLDRSQSELDDNRTSRENRKVRKSREDWKNGDDPVCKIRAEERDSEAEPTAHLPETVQETASDVITIVHLYPNLLNLYGDGGNVTVLANRIRWHGFGVEIMRFDYGQILDLSRADIVFLGGGPDREQHRASQGLSMQTDALRDYVEDGGVLLAICGGYQILGKTWLMGDETVPGLGIIDAVTERADGNAHNRLVGNIALESPLAQMPVIGYENHAGRTYLGSDVEPFGQVIGRHGFGNNDTDRADGILYRNVVGTYLHGPVLAKNPEVADWLIERALERRAIKEGSGDERRSLLSLSQLDDGPERAANEFMRERLHLR